jgi:hypothetical protein
LPTPVTLTLAAECADVGLIYLPSGPRGSDSEDNRYWRVWLGAFSDVLSCLGDEGLAELEVLELKGPPRVHRGAASFARDVQLVADKCRSENQLV